MSALVHIETIYDPEEAHVANSYLRANGIDALLGDAEALSTMPFYRVALGGHRVLVPEGQAEAARALLRKVRVMPTFSGYDCPRCGSNDFSRVKSWVFPAFFLALFAALVPFAHNARKLRCNNCGLRVSRNEGEDENVSQPEV